MLNILSLYSGKQPEHPTSGEKSTQDKESSTVPIIAGVVGAVVLLIIAVAFVLYIMRR